MDDKEKQIKMIETEIEEIEYNIETCDEHIGRLPPGDARSQFEEDKAAYAKGLDELKRKLTALQGP